MTNSHSRPTLCQMRQMRHEKGFTLIELSIVLVIIGLIVGGVLVGQDLIKAAEVRATVSQMEKYNTAVNTFRVKFNSLPGDISTANAAAFGFTARAGAAGQGDGNGLIDGEAGASSLLQGSGETGMFWVDLSSAAGGNLVDGSFTTATPTGTPTVASTAMGSYLPASKLSGSKYVYVFNDGSQNYYGLASTTAFTSGVLTSSPTVTVIQAYNIDKKVDDGQPATGNVIARYVTAGAITATSSAASDSTTTCYNTGGSYSLSAAANNGTGPNCALTFRFQ